MARPIVETDQIGLAGGGAALVAEHDDPGLELRHLEVLRRGNLFDAEILRRSGGERSKQADKRDAVAHPHSQWLFVARVQLKRPLQK